LQPNFACIYTPKKVLFNMRKALLIMLSGIFCALIQPMNAQTIVPDTLTSDTLISIADTLASDSVPEWYVAPEIPLFLRAPKHTAAAKCVMDSMLSFNVDSVLIEASHYEYDNAGRVIREIVWTYNADGSKTGKSKQEYSFDAYDNQVMTAVYAWDNATQTWKGTEKYEFVYDSEQRMISSIDYAWVTNEWKADDKKTWLYDAEGRVAEYFEYKRNTSNNELQYFKGFTKQWDADNRQTLNIQYTAAVNNVWTAGTKNEYAYDENGNLTLSTLSTISNGAWIGSTKETWYYGGPSGEMTLYETYGWANNDWSKTLSAEKEFDNAGRLIRIENYTYANGIQTGTKKEEYTFTSAGKPASTITYAWVGGTWVGATNETWLYDGPAGQLTLHEKFEWSNDDWSKTLKEETEYSGANIVRVENYTYANGVPTGTKKELTTYSGGKKTQILTFAWENGTWVNSNRETWEYNGPSGKQTKHEKCEWDGSDWTVMVQENTTYNGNTTTIENYERIAGVWTGTKKEENTVVGGKPTQTITYTWNGAWVESSKETWTYESGKTTSHEQYVWENNAWKGTAKEVWAFSGTYQTLHETYEWYNDDWSMTLREIAAFDAAGNQTLIENFTGTNGTIKGVKKEEYTFKTTTAGLKQTSKKTYTWNATKQAFVGKQWNVSDVDAAGNIIESCTYTYNTSKEAWVGTSTGRTLKTYNSDKNVIDEIVQKWNTSITPNGWLNNKRTTTEYYDSKNPILKIISKWSKDIEDWVGVTRQEWHYTDAGLNDSIRNFRFENDVWNPTSRTVKTYDENKNNILTHNADWDGEKWVMTSMTRLDIIDHTINGIRQVLQASWKCSADSIWIGDQKDTVAYLTDEKLLFRARYSSWSNGNWIPAYKIEYEYDEAQRNTLQQRLEWTNGAWVGKYRYEKLYDSAGRELLNASYDGWDTSRQDWVGNSKTTTTYNAAGKKETQTTYRWRGSQWEPLFTNQYGYDANGREVDVIVQMYLFENWINTNRTLKEYQGNTLVKENEYIWKNNQWVIASRNETYYDNDAQHKLRREVHGAWNNGAVTSFEHYYYMYSCDPCIIRFVNYDGTELESKTMDKGQMPSYSGETPVREGNAEYSYTFAGWTPEIVKVACSATYTATFTPVKNQYTITWLNDDDSQIDQTTVDYGIMPTHANPTKENTAEYTYTFTGWTPGIGVVTGEATYKATFSATKNKYTVTFKNGDEVLQTTEVAYGELPSYTGEKPTKDADVQYTYDFSEWSPALAVVQGEQTYTAQFSSTVNKYTVTFKNGDEVLQTTEIEYGEMPSYTGEKPTKEADAQYTYDFSEWSPALAVVQGEQTYTAQFSSTVNKYTVTFKNGDEVLQTTEVAYGEMPSYTGEKPTKDADAQYTYDFSEWSPELTAVQGEQTYTAQFSSTVNKYTVTFKNGDEVLQTTEIEYGEMPSYTGEKPTKEADAQYTYDFSEWSPALAVVQGEQTYTAQFSSTVNKYTVTFKNGDEVLQTTEIEYGEMPVYEGEKPTKDADVQYTYDFSEWSPELTAVQGEQTYSAQFSSTVNKYTIRFINDDETELQSSEVEYGTMPTYNGETPHKDADEQYTYTFAEWDQEIVSVTGEATYKATYSSTVNQYTVRFLNYDGEELQSSSWNYGAMPSYSGETPTKPADAQDSYVFAEWSPVVTIVTKDATYTATYTSTTNSYTITWLNDDDSQIDQTTVAYGETPTHADAEKPNTAEWTYTFEGWTPEIVVVDGDASYKATFSATKNSYTITWLNYDGSELEHETLEYGATPEYKGTEPSKEATAQYTYYFSGWDKEIVEVTGDAAYTATYNSTLNSYTIRFINDDETELQSSEVEYGTMPTYDGETPHKDADEQYTYTFAEWDQEIVSVTGEATYKATYSSTVNQYTVKFLNYDGEELQSSSWNYGAMPSYSGETPTKPADAQDSYVFADWSPVVTIVTKDATYTATYTSSTNSYTITWLNDDDSQIDQTTVAYGETPTHADAEKPNTAEWTYTFEGWTPEIIAVDGDATYKATFSATKNSYTIRFINDDDSELQSSEVEYGTMPTYNGEMPHKDADEQYTYTFAEWDQEIVSVTGEATYKATYSSTVNQYTITWLNEDGSELEHETLEYGATPQHVAPEKENTAEWTYTFEGWNPTIESVTEDATYQATFFATKNSYTITWLNDDGSVIESETLEYGATPSHADIYKESTAEWIYTFAGWDPEIESVTGDATYTATFDAVEATIYYHITVMVDDAAHGKAGFIYADSESATLLTDYDVASGTWIELQAIASEDWHFDHWSDGDIASVRQIEVTEDMQITAHFASNCGDYPTLPVVSLYDWLVMLDVRSIHAMGYTFSEEDVIWYRVKGEPDKESDGAQADDVRVGTGYSFTLNESLINSGDYYAMVDVSSSPAGTLCSGMMRSQIVHFASNRAYMPPRLTPALVRPSEPQQILHLDPEFPTTVTIYDLSGHLLRTFSEEGVDRIDMQAESVTGCYQVVVQNGDQRNVLRYIVVQ